MQRIHRFGAGFLQRIAVILAVAGASLAPLAIQAPAHAAWVPNISPLHTGSGERVIRNLDQGDRNYYLWGCSSWIYDGYACIATKESDGEYSVFFLKYCNTRSLSNFMGRAWVMNNQTGGARVHFWGSGKHAWIPADDDTIYTVDAYPFNEVDLC
jgi:hypothetical protein